VNKLKVKGMNAVFGLQVSLSLRLVRLLYIKKRMQQNSAKVVFVWERELNKNPLFKAQPFVQLVFVQTV
jgi:hypothetical protein